METEKKVDQPKSQFKGKVGVMRQNNAYKTKSATFVSTLSTINTSEMVDSNKIDRSTGAVIKKPDVIMAYNVVMGSVDLVQLGIDSVQFATMQSIERRRKIAELYLGISIYNSFILWKKMNPDKQNAYLLNH